MQAEQGRTFAVGDVHGQSRLLRELIARLRHRATPGDTLVFVGDYIDRGPDSRGVIDQVLELEAGGWPGPVVPLKGNHEELMLDALLHRHRFDLEIWLVNGGLQTLASYCQDRRLRDWRGWVPPDHRAFLERLRLWHEDAHGIYVHAGLPPGVPPEQAPEEALLWIRDEFIQSDYRWRKVVVFGHTPQYEPTELPEPDPRLLKWRPLNRPEKIGIDTGAAYGGPLTAVMLPEREFFSVR